MPQPKSFIVGRQTEVECFAALVGDHTDHWLLNIYGPGGIGKTVVCNKLEVYARGQGLPVAAVDGIHPDLTPDRILHAVVEAFKVDERLTGAFRGFERAFEEYLVVQDVLQRGGGVPAMFDVVGNVKDPAGFAGLLGGLGKSITETVQRTVCNRFALERYLRGVEKTLTAKLSDGLGAALEKAAGPLALLVDTYEEMEGLDDWVCRTFVPALPEGIKVVVFGRNALPKVNFDWGEYGKELHMMELPELPEGDAKAYLAHHGLRDPTMQDEVYRFTGGYPLVLVLVVHLAREAGGWKRVGALESAADRDRVASKLLDRILREERAREVRDFLEKGVVARWFTPEIVRVVLDVGPEEGRAIYDKLQRHSFVERHPYGLRFHDKIRELLLERLKFDRPEYERISQRLMDYYAEKAGITQPSASEEQLKPEPLGGAKYAIHIERAEAIVIGDQARVSQQLSGEPLPPARPETGSPGSGKRCADLTESIRETLDFIKKYEDQHRLAADPKATRHAEREIADMRSQLAAYEAEYRELDCS